MSIRLFVVVAVAALLTSEADARNGFGSRRFRSTTPRSRPAAPQAIPRVSPDILSDPVKMTKKYGPSILIRSEAKQDDNTTIVKQPS
ncbi:MAG: hypothetical protein AB8B91_19170 [Rubripirellula sp.]